MSDQHIGKYRIEERLGSGTFATVYRCFDPDLDTTCAIKVLAENWSEDVSARNWFLNEARVMFGIEHPSILRIFTSGTLEDGRPYFVMEFANQGSLADLIRSRRNRGESFTTGEALEISIAIAEGLNVAHNRALVHRDLKPSNILFRDGPVLSASKAETGEIERQIKLADFGLARGLEQGANSLAGAGTPHYIAPEQASGAVDELPDVRNDIYSAATIFYEMLVGQVPFPYRSMTEVVAAHLNEEPTPVQELAPHVPDEVAQLVHAGLAKDPEKRVATATIWRDQLQVLRTALNADGSIAGWAAGPFVASQLESDDGIPVDPGVHDQDTVAAPGHDPGPTMSALLTHTNTRVHSGEDVDVTPSEPLAEINDEKAARSGGFMVPYIIAAIAAGMLVVGILGFALADLVPGDPNDGADEPGITADLDATADDSEDIGVIPPPTPTVDATETEEPELTREPDPTPTPEPTEEPEPDPTPTPEPTEVPDDGPEVAEISRILQQLPGMTSSAVVLPSGEPVDESGRQQAAAGSTIKLWIAATAYDEVVNGDLDLDDEHTITAEDQAFGTGILNQGGYLGQTLPVADLIEIMLQYSDNTAANIVIDLVGGIERVNEYTEENGYEDTQMQRLLGDLDPERENLTSAHDGALFMSRLLDNEVVNEDASRLLRSALEQRSANDSADLDFFGRDLPTGVSYAHISGLLPGVRNEIGYFHSDERDGYVVVSFMLGDLSDESDGESAIAGVVGEIHGEVVAMN